MFTASAALYDLIYSTFKDYAGEAAQITTLLRRLSPQSQTILDVACGTGEHARLLAAQGFIVDGIDLDPAFVRIAKQKHPGGRFFEADMSDFDLGYRYDAVLCLFVLSVTSRPSIEYGRRLSAFGTTWRQVA